MAALNEKLLISAQYLMDSYYQDFAPDDSFFRLEDFATWVGRAYGKIADDSAQLIYKGSLSESGQGQIIFSQDWWSFKDYDVKEKDGQLSIALDIKYLGFTYDNQNSGIQLLTGLGHSGNCGNFKRTTLTQLWKLSQHTMNSIVWWYPSGETISFSVMGSCKPKKVRVWYLPSVEDENFKLPSTKEFDIAYLAFQFLKAAQTGTIVDETADRNANKTIQTESNSAQLKQLNP